MLKVAYTVKMKWDVKRMRKRGKDMQKLDAALRLLVAQTPMPGHYRDHRLTGKLSDFRECHIEPDWLLLYQIFEDRLVLSASGTGTHSDLFNE
ncbi:MAG: type II toxin-antitoxin system YafQ family toxin [Candidatus Adiutrix sp.]|jgi:mRNA interferase YafQ|nr:type II toxin-antitoxin system YafQ family toxin [Candidatus Adiutrix sp.]